MQGPEVRSGDFPQPIILKEGQEFNFTIKRGVCTEDTVSVNYDGFVNDVDVGDILLVDGKCSTRSWLLIDFRQIIVFGLSDVGSGAGS